MLWQAVIAALAVSCTLTRILALGQAAQRLDRIKDLICVLLLSGMQKEDLEVSLLSKLQRYNVNIDEMNNEDLVGECIKIRSQSEHDKNIGNNQLQTSERNIDVSNSFTTELIAYAKPIKPLTIPKSVHNFNYPELREEMQRNKKTIQYDNQQPKIESVLKFWQDMKLNKFNKKPDENLPTYEKENLFDSEQKNKRNVPKEPKESDIVKKMVEAYLRRSEISDAQKTSIKSTYVTDVPYDDEISYNNKNDQNINTHYIDFPRNISDTQNNIQLLRNPSTEAANTDYKNNNNYTDFNEMLSVLNKIKSKYLTQDKYPFINKNNIYKNGAIYTYTTTTDKATTINFDKDMIQEIAQSVKELVLRDLRKDIEKQVTAHIFNTSILSITSTSQSTTKMSTVQSSTQADISQSPIKNENPVKTEDKLLIKFLELFEEIKSVKAKSITISSANTNNVEVKKEMKTETLYPVLMPGDTAQLNQPVYTGNQPYINGKTNNIFKFSPQIHKFRSNEGFTPSTNEAVSSKLHIPITYQTNNMEIPPLRITVDKPQNPIQQNLIVTVVTKAPYRIGVGDTHAKTLINNFRANTRHHRGRERDDKYKKQHHSPLPKLSNHVKNAPVHIVHKIYSNREDNGMRYSSNENEHSAYNTDFNEDVNVEKYKPRFDRIMFQDKRPEMPRFHERLEKMEEYDNTPERIRFHDRTDCCDEKYAFTDQMDNCCNRKLVPRKQTSYKNSKKGSGYDDTHFKNFLKSQQKVTDMLEQILAARGKVKSVETI